MKKVFVSVLLTLISIVYAAAQPAVDKTSLAKEIYRGAWRLSIHAGAKP